MGMLSVPPVSPLQPDLATRELVPDDVAAVPVTSELAAIWERGAALLLDGLILLGLASVIAILFGEGSFETVTTADERRAGVSIKFGDLFFRPVLLGWFVYLMVAEAKFGTTLGKRLVGLTVVRTDVSPLTISSAVLRHLTHLVPIVVLAHPLAFAVCIVEAVVAKVSHDRRRLGDRLGGTIVVHRPPAARVSS
jgi:uncharacterized RDD family membrane protein YckC